MEKTSTMNHTKGQKGKRKDNPPERQCVLCREKKPKDRLLRIVRTEDGVLIDPTGRKNGRGAYVCTARSCIEKASRTGALSKALNVTIPQDLIEELLTYIKDE